MKKIMYLLLFSSLTLACGKKHKINVLGRVYNPVTNEGIANAEIKFLVGDDITQLPGGMKKIGGTTTDANGYFHAEAKHRRDIFLQVEIPDNFYRLGWYNEGIYRGPSLIKAEKNATMQPEYRAVPYGQTILDIQNVNCSGPTDTMWFRHRSQFENEFPESWSTPRVGCYTYISPSPNPNLYMGTRYYQVRVKRNGQTSITEHEFFINQNGVTTLQLHY
jgi:hypothetical protein